MSDWERVRRLSIIACRQMWNDGDITAALSPAYATVSAILVLSRYAVQGVPADAATCAAIEKIFDAQDADTKKFLDESEPR